MIGFFSAKRRFHHENLKDLMNNFLTSLQDKYQIEHSGPVFLLCFIEAFKNVLVYIYNIKIKDFCLCQYVIYGPQQKSIIDKYCRSIFFISK